MFYLYDSTTMEFTKGTEGQPDPLGGGFFTPPLSTTKTPPSVTATETAIFNGTTWDIVADYRGSLYWNTETKAPVVFEIGDIPDETMTDVEPVGEHIKWDGTAWVTDEWAQYEEMFNYVTGAVEERLNLNLKAYNMTNNTAFKSAHNCESYSRVVGYPHQPFCQAYWEWSVNLWVAVRAWSDGIVAMPTEVEMTTILDSVPFVFPAD